MGIYYDITPNVIIDIILLFSYLKNTGTLFLSPLLFFDPNDSIFKTTPAFLILATSMESLAKFVTLETLETVTVVKLHVQ